MLEYSSINSGSNGNCYYIGNENEAVFIDAGIHCSEIEKRMVRLGLSMQKIKAIFITHEHTDHIRGVYKLAKKYNLPVYLTAGTLSGSYFNLSDASVICIEHNESIQIGDLNIETFAKKHDASAPVSFTVEHLDTRIAVMTDIGSACSNVIHHIRHCDAAILESNYDTEMLLNGSYPNYLKQRIRSGNGHLSNDEAVALVRDHSGDHLKHLILAHLSKENNHPDRALAAFAEFTARMKIEVAPRYNESPVYRISRSGLQESGNGIQMSLNDFFPA